MEQGNATEAIAELRYATQLLPTNALAFNYLGLAFHQAGQPVEAERAYLRALALDHDLTEVHYDLGCLWMNQSNRLDQAKSELTAYTLRRPNAAEGWLRLGEAQLRLRELTGAEKSLSEALRLEPQNPETLTTLGMVRYQRKRANEAAQCFSRALKEQPTYAPALLNLAIVAQQDLGDSRLALQKYREYLALKPAPENSPAVNVITRQLEQSLNVAAGIESPINFNVVAATNHLVSPNQLEQPRTGMVAKPTATNQTHLVASQKSEPPTNLTKAPVLTNGPKTVPVTNVAPPDNLQVVKLSPEPTIKSAEDIKANVAPKTAPAPDTEAPAEYTSTTAAVSEAKPAKRGFFQKINPANLFAKDNKPAPKTTPLVANSVNRSDINAVPNIEKAAVEPRTFPRYTYRTPGKPVVGDHSAAEKAFGLGVREQQAGKLPESILAYRKATQLDPSYYDAHYNLGLASSQNGNLQLALAAYEMALTIQPESLDARYNFGLVLKQAGYISDAVNEFEKILSKYPNDGRTHLALGNLYAQQIQDPGKAREHYLAVLAIAPQSPQAGAIRYWLSDHPK